ncbi:MAG: ParA family protein [Spirochaetota bacterium]
MKTIALANQKGGVGKTTTTINLGAYLANEGQRVLIIDIDPQGNAGSGLGLDITQEKSTIYHWLIGQATELPAQPTNQKNLDIIPANIDLSGFEIDVREDNNRDYILKNRLAQVSDRYDFVLIDCPPSLGILTINALTAANSVLIPLQCEYFALEGLTQLLRIINLVRTKLNPQLVIEGVLLTMFDARTKLASQVVQDVREHFRKQVYDVIIPRNVKLSEAPSFGQPISVYDPQSTGAIAYKTLAKDLLARQGATA